MRTLAPREQTCRAHKGIKCNISHFILGHYSEDSSDVLCNAYTSTKLDSLDKIRCFEIRGYSQVGFEIFEACVILSHAENAIQDLFFGGFI